MVTSLSEFGKQSNYGAPLTSIVFIFSIEVNGAPKQHGYAFSSKYLPFGRTKKFIQVWNYFRLSKWWQHFHFWVNYPFKPLNTLHSFGCPRRKTGIVKQSWWFLWLWLLIGALMSYSERGSKTAILFFYRNVRRRIRVNMLSSLYSLHTHSRQV